MRDSAPEQGELSDRQYLSVTRVECVVMSTKRDNLSAYRNDDGPHLLCYVMG